VDASADNVGIGASSPGAKLEVNGAIRSLRSGSTAAVLQVINDNNSWNITSGTTTAQFRIDNNLLGTALTIDSSNNLLVGTTTAGTKSGNGVIGIGASGGIVTNSADSIADNGTLDIAINTGGGGYQGFLLVANTNVGSASIRTQRTYSVFGRGTDSSIQQIATDNGASGGAAFTVTTPSNGVIRVTNTSGNTTAIAIQFFGGTSL
jgi:hypothetical protein